MYSSTIQFVLYTGLVCLMSSGRVYSQETEPLRIACGVLNVGQVRQVKIPISNNGKRNMIVDRVSICCGNPRPTIDKKAIRPGQSAELTQQVTRSEPGHFRMTGRVSFKQPENKQLVFAIEGEARQPIRAWVGWDAMPLKEVDYYEKEIRLDTVHQSGKDLAIRLTADPGVFDLEDALLSVESEYFALDRRSIEFRRVQKQKATVSGQIDGGNDDKAEGCIRQIHVGRVVSKQSPPLNPLSTLELMLRVRPGGSFPIGELTDKIVLVFRDESKCYLPLAFRAVGDVYGETSVLGLGQISRSKTTTIPFSIHFLDKERVWPEITLKVEGILSNAVSVFVRDDDSDDNRLDLMIEVDGRALPSACKGYIVSRIWIMEEGNDRETVPLVLYGYM